jgi:hypothetical protein
MASRQRLKKEIDYVVSDLVLDCFTFNTLQQKPNDEAVRQIVQDTLALRNTLRYQVNHPESKATTQTVKNYFDNIAKVLIDSVDESYAKLGKLINPDA